MKIILFKIFYFEIKHKNKNHQQQFTDLQKIKLAFFISYNILHELNKLSNHKTLYLIIHFMIKFEVSTLAFIAK